MDTADWCGLIVRTRARLPFGVVVGMFTDGPHAGRLRVHGLKREEAKRRAYLPRVERVLVPVLPDLLPHPVARAHGTLLSS